jgi:hypothetical protein
VRPDCKSTDVLAIADLHRLGRAGASLAGLLLTLLGPATDRVATMTSSTS